jgi:hypothetical protein
MNTLIKNLPTIILRLIAILSAVVGVLMCIFAFPPLGAAIVKNFPEYAFWQYPVLAGLYSAAVCFFFALFHFWLLLNSIDRNGTLSAKNLKNIRYSTVVFTILYFIFAMPIVFFAAEADDAPGAILIGVFLGTLPLGFAAVAAILERIACKCEFVTK